MNRQKSYTLIFTLFCVFIQPELSAQSSWQQKLVYDIDVRLDDSFNMLHGECKIDYTNNSPDTLSFILVHLYPNAFKSESSFYSRQQNYNRKTKFYFSKKKEKGYMDSIFFTVNGKECFYSEYLENEDIIYIELPEKIFPDETITLKTPFRVKIPEQFSRLGHDGKSYFISQWYPKPAVYDQHGWHPIPYADIGEFYGEYADFNVNISLPQDYIVASSGVIQDSSEYAFLGSHEYDPSTTVFNMTIDSLPSIEASKTVHIKQKNVHDFAWAADRNFLVLKDTVLAGDKIVDIFLYAKADKMGTFKAALKPAKETITNLSDKLGTYPYSQVHLVYDHAFDPSVGGMEYPTYTIIYTLQPGMLEEVVYHEVAHNWFYGILGNNERKEPFMDESFTSFLDNQLVKEYTKPKSSPKEVIFSLENSMSRILLGRNKHYNVNLPATEYTEMLYGVFIYGIGTQYLDYLSEYLGKDTFQEILSTYFQRYKWKHHSYQDFLQHLEEKSESDVSWFSKAVKNSQYPLDFRLKSSGYQKKKGTLKIENLAPYPAPVSVQVNTSDTNFVFWTDPIEGSSTIQLPIKGKVKNISLNSDNSIPEVNTKNNDLKKGFRLKPFTSLSNKSHKREIYFLPTLGYNYYDGFLAGIGFHNTNLRYKKLNYWINPMFGTNSGTVVGNMGLNKNWVTYNSATLKSIDFNLFAKSFHQSKSNRSLTGEHLYSRYIRVNPEIAFHFDNHALDNIINKDLTFGFYYTQQEAFQLNTRPSDSVTYLTKGWADPDYFGVISYKYSNNRLFNPFSYKFSTHLNQDFVKLLGEANIKINYNYRKKGIKLRGFGGWMYSEERLDNAYYLQAANDGQTDYLYNETFLGRNKTEGFYSNQFFVREGGFKSGTPQLNNRVGSAKNWMVALNSSIEIPMFLPLNFFIDVATFDRSSMPSDRTSDLLFNSGVSFESRSVGIYLPLFYSEQYKNYYTFNTDGHWYNRITFQFSINLEDLWHPEKILN